jgi:short subunit dehydrogenase-like uncharacterized protein
MDFLLYGANGYTGQLIAELCAQQGMTPLLAGRSEAKIKPIADRLGFPYQAFDLTDTEALQGALRQVPVVLHCAGPYAHTFQPMVEACLQTQTHYLDITGEIAVFEAIARRDQEAKEAGVMLLPGCGFDVVPTDCMAAYLVSKMPDATHLELAFKTDSGLSHGTAKTAIENINLGGMVRQEGKIVKVRSAHAVKEVVFATKPYLSVAIPWGDVSTAWYTTGIPNITTYAAQPPRLIRIIRISRYFGWLLSWEPIQRFLKKRIEKQPAGPSAEKRQRLHCLVWGEVRNAKGEVIEARLKTAEAYALTAMGSLIITRKVLNGNAPTGFQTPAGAYGYELVQEIEGSEPFR